MPSLQQFRLVLGLEYVPLGPLNRQVEALHFEQGLGLGGPYRVFSINTNENNVCDQAQVEKKFLGNDTYIQALLLR